MNIKDFLKEINKRATFYDKNAKNPFLNGKIEYNYAQNPFYSALRETRVWVEKED